jgi:hypothetical protein
MSYRNDHDAATARVDALQAEYAQLSAENTRLRAALAARAPQPPATPATPTKREPVDLGTSIFLGLALGLILLALIFA